MTDFIENVGGLGVVIVGLVGIIAAFFIFFTWLTMWAWNIFMPAIFGLPTITFWQAFALSILAGLFKTYNFSLKK